MIKLKRGCVSDLAGHFIPTSAVKDIGIGDITVVYRGNHLKTLCHREHSMALCGNHFMSLCQLAAGYLLILLLLHCIMLHHGLQVSNPVFSLLTFPIPRINHLAEN